MVKRRNVQRGEHPPQLWGGPGPRGARAWAREKKRGEGGKKEGKRKEKKKKKRKKEEEKKEEKKKEIKKNEKKEAK